MIADTKAQVALSRCRNFKCNDPLAHVCWLCVGNCLRCLGAFGQGISILLKVWQWGGGVTLPAVLLFQRPPDFGLHGVHRLVHSAGSGLVNGLMHHHGWTKGRALVRVQSENELLKGKVKLLEDQVADRDAQLVGVRCERQRADELLKERDS